jgi:hypothetical protein
MAFVGSHLALAGVSSVADPRSASGFLGTPRPRNRRGQGLDNLNSTRKRARETGPQPVHPTPTTPGREPAMTTAPAEEPARSIARYLLDGVKPHAYKMAAYGPEVRANTIVGLSFAVLALVDEVAGLRKDLAAQQRPLQ